MATLSASYRSKPSISITASSSGAVPLRSRLHQPLPSVNHIFLCPPHLNSSIFLFASNRFSRSAVCSAAVGPPPDSDPPPEKEPVRLTGIPAFLSKVQDRVQIFLAVLFWMSLFFWTSAWDGKNRPDKGSRFRR